MAKVAIVLFLLIPGLLNAQSNAESPFIVEFNGDFYREGGAKLSRKQLKESLRLVPAAHRQLQTGRIMELSGDVLMAAGAIGLLVTAESEFAADRILSFPFLVSGVVVGLVGFPLVRIGQKRQIAAIHLYNEAIEQGPPEERDPYRLDHILIDF
jgi:hypothetical protein